MVVVACSSLSLSLPLCLDGRGEGGKGGSDLPHCSARRPSPCAAKPGRRRSRRRRGRSRWTAWGGGGKGGGRGEGLVSTESERRCPTEKKHNPKRKPGPRPLPARHADRVGRRQASEPWASERGSRALVLPPIDAFPIPPRLSPAPLPRTLSHPPAAVAAATTHPPPATRPALPPGARAAPASSWTMMARPPTTTTSSTTPSRRGRAGER
jgi:hypothetical protein